MTSAQPPALTFTLTPTLTRFVIDQFEVVLRMHARSLPAVDVGNQGRGQYCADPSACLLAARQAGCVGPDSILSLGRERGGLSKSSIRTLLDDIFRPKLGIFGGPPTASAHAKRR